MSFRILDKEVYWMNSKIRNENSNDFLVVHPSIAIINSSVYFRGIKLKLESKGLIMLSDYYGITNKAAFFVYGDQLRVIDLNSKELALFQVLNSNYARVSHNLYYQGILLPRRYAKNYTQLDLQKIYPISEDFISDAHSLYFRDRKLFSYPPSVELNFSKLRIKTVGNHNEKLLPEILLCDFENQYVSFRGEPLNKSNSFIDFNTYRIPIGLSYIAGDNHNGLRIDISNAYQNGILIPEVDPDDLIFYGENVYSSNGQLFSIFRKVSYNPVNLKWIIQDVFTDNALLYYIAKGKLPPDENTAPLVPQYMGEVTNIQDEDLDDLLHEALAPVVTFLLKNFDKCFPSNEIYDKNLGLQETHNIVPDDLHFTIIQAKLCFSVPSLNIFLTGTICGFYRLTVLLWGKLRKRSDVLLSHTTAEDFAKNPSKLVLESFSESRIAWIKLISLLSHPLSHDIELDELRCLAYLIGVKSNASTSKSLIPLNDLALLPRIILEFTRPIEEDLLTHTIKQYNSSKSIIYSNLLSHEDCRVRYEVVTELFRCVIAEKPPQDLFRFVIPKIIESIEQEPLPLLQDLLGHIVDISALIAVNHGYYDIGNSVIHWLVKQRINYDENRFRLIETLISLQKFEEAEIEEGKLLDDFKLRLSGWALPANYSSNRGEWRDVRLYLIYVKLYGIQHSVHPIASFSRIKNKIQEDYSELREYYFTLDKTRAVENWEEIRVLDSIFSET